MANKELTRKFVTYEEAPEEMIPLNEDGSLDIERVHNLPLDLRVKVISKLSESQFLSYMSFSRLYKLGKLPVRAITVDYTMGEDIARGNGVEAFGFLETMRKKYL